MDIGIIGSGRIGQALGRKWVDAGHRVTFGVRDSANAPDFGSSDSVVAALAASIVVLAIPGPAAAQLLIDHANELSGTLVIDASNSVGQADLHHAKEAAGIPGVRYARAFSCLGAENIVEPRIGDEVLDMFFSCLGADVDTVAGLVADTGLHPVWVGEGAQGAQVVDGVTRLWFALVMGQGRSRHLGFRVVT